MAQYFFISVSNKFEGEKNTKHVVIIYAPGIQEVIREPA